MRSGSRYFLSLRGRVDGLCADFCAAMRHDLSMGQGFAWYAVAFLIGILIYFQLPREPSLTILLFTTVLGSSIVFLRARWGRGFFLWTLVVFALAGLTSAKVRTYSVATPVLTTEITSRVVGTVERVELRPKDMRLTFQVQSIAKLPSERWPRRIRLTVRGVKEPPPIGQIVTFRARLFPPQGPVLPGGYPFYRKLYFQQIGATGFIYGALQPVAEEVSVRTLLSYFERHLAQLRQNLAAYILRTVPAPSAGVAVALLVGEQAGIDAKTKEALRISGLAHILSISGLHMALVAGFVFFCLRAFLACFPPLALAWPLKKGAAAVALIATTLYLALSGASVATQRSYIMSLIVLIGVMTGRPALTRRALALACLLVAFLRPEEVLEPGFQMSFAASLALIAAYEGGRTSGKRIGRSRGGASFWQKGRFGTPFFAFLRSVSFWILGLVSASFVAGLATAPYSISHFYRLAPLTVLGNLLAMPLVSFIVMPAGVLSMLALPFGLDPLPLQLMAFGIQGVLFMAQLVADLSENAGMIGLVSNQALIFVTGGFLWLCLWTNHWRFLGIIPVFLGILCSLERPKPDLLISENGRVVLARSAEGHLHVNTLRGSSFLYEVWALATATLPSEEGEHKAKFLRKFPKMAPSQQICPKESGFCWIKAYPDPSLGASSLPFRLAFVFKEEGFARACPFAESVVSPLKAPAFCQPPQLFDRHFLNQSGALALFLTEVEGRGRVEKIRRARPSSHRPWENTPDSVQMRRSERGLVYL